MGDASDPVGARLHAHLDQLARNNTMSKSLISTLGSYLRFDARGNVRWDDTLGAIKLQLQNELEESKKNDAAFSLEIDRFFDRFKGETGVKITTLASLVATRIAGDDLELSMDLEPQVIAFIKRTPRFNSKRGKGGGVFRLAKGEMPAPVNENEEDESDNDLDLDNL